MHSFRNVCWSMVAILAACGDPRVSAGSGEVGAQLGGEEDALKPAGCAVSPAVVALGGQYTIAASGLRRATSAVVDVTMSNGKTGYPVAADAYGKLTLTNTATAAGAGLVQVSTYYNSILRLVASCRFTVVDAPRCGDGVCDGDETCQSCGGDCGACPITPPEPITPPDPTTPPDPIVPTGPQLYVSTSGDDANPGSQAAPWRSIQKAMSAATPGSTVNIMAGTYHERLQLNVSGTAAQPIVFQNANFSPAGTAPGSGANGDVVVLDYAYLGTITDTIPVLDISGRQYVTIQGLIFQNATYNGGGPQWGVRISGSSTDHIQFKYNKLLHFHEADGAATALSAFYIINGAHHNLVYGCEFGDILPALSETFTIGGASYNTVESCYFHDTYNIALSVFCGPNYPGTTVDNVLRGNLLEYVGFRRDGSVLTDSAYPSGSSAIYLNGPIPGTIVERNTIRNSSLAINLDAESGNAWPVHDVVIRNNVIYADPTFSPAADMSGIKVGTFYSNTDGTRVYNIDVLNNTLDRVWYALYVRPYQSATVRWENNSVTNARRFAVFNYLAWPIGTEAHNLWHNNAAGTNGAGAHDVFLDPQYGAGFCIAAGSPAKDAGDPAAASSDQGYSAAALNVGTVDYLGHTRFLGTIDIGACETQ